MGQYLFRRNFCKRKKIKKVACERRTSAQELWKNFSRERPLHVSSPRLKHSCHSDRCANFSSPLPSFYRDQIRPVNFPLLSFFVRLSTTYSKIFRLEETESKRFKMEDWKKKKIILEVIAQCVPI